MKVHVGLATKDSVQIGVQNGWATNIFVGVPTLKFIYPQIQLQQPLLKSYLYF